MPDYTLTLSQSQEDALQFLTEQARIAQDDEGLTADEVLQTFVNTALQPTEAAIQVTMNLLLTAGNALPAVVRTRMTEALTGPQLELIEHLQSPMP